MSHKESVPLVVLDAGGNVAAVLACNSKSRTKTLEQGELWVLRPDNGRVLPYRGGGVRCGAFTHHDDGTPDGDGGSDTFVGGGWFQVVVRAESRGDAGTNGLNPRAPAPGPHPSRAGRDDRPASDDKGQGFVTAEGAPRALPVLTALADLIAERHQTLPEGSYTTHLFSRGPSKIRKKAGEEAVELILADTRDEIISEAADLVYHVMVLLEVEGIRIEDVVGELERRHAG